MKLLIVATLLQLISIGAIVWLAMNFRQLRDRHERLKEAHARDQNELNALRGRRDHAVMVQVNKREPEPQPTPALSGSPLP